MYDCRNLEYGIKYDLTMTNGTVQKEWYLYSADCGYFTKEEGKMVGGMIYSECVKSVSESKTGE